MMVINDRFALIPLNIEAFDANIYMDEKRESHISSFIELTLNSTPEDFSKANMLLLGEIEL
jgi:hypothetical protein